MNTLDEIISDGHSTWNEVRLNLRKFMIQYTMKQLSTTAHRDRMQGLEGRTIRLSAEEAR